MNTYRVVLQELNESGQIVKSFEACSNPKEQEDEGMAEVLGMALFAFTPNYKSGPDTINSGYELIKLIAHETCSELLKDLTAARDDWSCKHDFEKCVSLVVNREMLLDESD